MYATGVESCKKMLYIHIVNKYSYKIYIWTYLLYSIFRFFFGEIFSEGISHHVWLLLKNGQPLQIFADVYTILMVYFRYVLLLQMQQFID